MLDAFRKTYDHLTRAAMVSDVHVRIGAARLSYKVV
jgi:hypothetical protein